MSLWLELSAARCEPGRGGPYPFQRRLHGFPAHLALERGVPISAKPSTVLFPRTNFSAGDSPRGESKSRAERCKLAPAGRTHFSVASSCSWEKLPGRAYPFQRAASTGGRTRFSARQARVGVPVSARGKHGWAYPIQRSSISGALLAAYPFQRSSDQRWPDSRLWSGRHALGSLARSVPTSACSPARASVPNSALARPALDAGGRLPAAHEGNCAHAEIGTPSDGPIKVGRIEQDARLVQAFLGSHMLQPARFQYRRLIATCILVVATQEAWRPYAPELFISGG